MRVNCKDLAEIYKYAKSDLALYDDFFRNPFEKLYKEAKERYIVLRSNNFIPDGVDPKSEIWKDIEGYTGLYCVSNLGRIKSIKNGKDSIRNLSFGNQAYLSVGLSRNSKTKSYLIHRLVCDAFIPNADEKLYVNHKNSLRYDNRVINLEWVTSSENILHSYINGKRGQDSDWVYVCRELGIATLTIKDLCDKLYKWGHHSVNVNDIYKMEFNNTFQYKSITFEVFKKESLGKIDYCPKMKFAALCALLSDWYICGGYHDIDIYTILEINKIRFNIQKLHYRELVRTAKSLNWKTCENMRLKDNKHA